MKKILSSVLAFVMTATVITVPFGSSIAKIIDTFSISAAAAVSGDYEYTALSNGTVKITKYNGSAQKISIPGKIGGKNVTVIGNAAFEQCTSITDITIPNGVTTIEDDAFGYCENLKNVSLPDSLAKIGERAFRYCSSIASLNIPNSVTEIAFGAFWGCSSLSEINIPTGLKTIEPYVFQWTAMKNITIPDNITVIGESAFSGCDFLKKISISDSVTTIKNNAFENCTVLSEVKLPNKLKSIDTAVFSGCESLKKITIPNSVTEIGASAFADSGIENLTVPDSVTVINEEAFSFSSLSQVTLSKNLKEIRPWTFKGCTDLKSIEIPEGITSIQTGAFDYCKSLTDVSLPSSLTEIQWEAFQDCTLLDNITVPNSVKTIGQSVFERCGSLKNITLPDTITEIPDRMFYECYSINKIEIPDTVTKIGDGAFDECFELTDISMPSKLKSIGDSAFYRCTGLSYLTLSDSVEHIGSSAFVGTNISDIHFPKDLKAVGKNPFGSTPYAKNTTEGDALYWGNWLVWYNEEAESVDIKKGTEHIADRTFQSSHTKGKLILPDGIKTIGEGAFSLSSFEEIVMPDSVTEIGEYAFDQCYVLKKIVLSKNLSSIGYLTFGQCYALKDVEIPENVKYVGSLAFFESGIVRTQTTDIKYVSNWIVSAYNVPAKLTIKDGVVGICESAFIDQPKEITIPKSVKYIGPHAVGYYTVESSSLYKIKDFKMYCYSGSAAEKYAKDNGLTYELLDKPAHTHSYTSKITKQPTCTTTGIRTYTCTCGDKYTKSIPAKGHSYKAVTVKSTYFAKGYTANKCSTCGAIKDKKYSSLLQMSAPKATVSAYTIKLTWSKVTGAKGYEVWQLKSGKWTKIKTISSTSYTVSKLPSGTSQKFAIKPYTKSGSKTVYGAFSKQLYTSTNPATVNFKLTAGSRKATVKWNKVTGASGYKIYYKTSKNGSWKLIKTVNNKTTSYTKTGLAKGKTYYFTVKAYRTINGTTFNGAYATKSIKIK